MLFDIRHLGHSFAPCLSRMSRLEAAGQPEGGRYRKARLGRVGSPKYFVESLVFVNPRSAVDPVNGGRRSKKRSVGMSKNIWSMLSYLGALSLVLGGLSACDDTGVSAPSFGESASAQSAAATPAAGASGSAAVPMAHLTPCPMIPDTVNIHSQADLDAFDSLECFTVERHLFVQNTSDIVDLSPLHGLRSVGGYIGIADNTDLKYVKLPNLVKTGEGLVLEGNHALRKISAPALRYVKGNLHIFNNQALKSVSFDWLISVGEDMIFAGNNALKSLELPKLTTIMGQFIFEHSER